MRQLQLGNRSWKWFRCHAWFSVREAKRPAACCSADILFVAESGLLPSLDVRSTCDLYQSPCCPCSLFQPARRMASRRRKEMCKRRFLIELWFICSVSFRSITYVVPFVFWRLPKLMSWWIPGCWYICITLYPFIRIRTFESRNILCYIRIRVFYVLRSLLRWSVSANVTLAILLSI